MVFNNNLLLGASGAGGYTIDQSIRFNDNDSAYLYRTPSAGNRKTWTWSAWVKRGNFTGATQRLWGSTPSSGSNNFNYGGIFFSSTDTLNYGLYDTSFRVSSAKFRDPSAWYHIVVALDTTQATASNRLHMYVNGVELTSFSTSNDPALNTDYSINQNAIHTLGSAENFSALYKLDGYLAEIHFIDGQQLDPSSFGEVNSDTGQWIAKEYSGSYGTNGFYITGETASDLGEDFSGNSNDWTSSGLAAADQMSDSPTNNWCVLNSINLGTSETLANGNLDVANSASAWRSFSGTHGVSSGKWYWEATQTGTVSGSNSALIGIAEYQEADFARLAVVTKIGPAAGGYAFENWSGDKRDPAETSSSYGSAVTSGQIVGVALDLDNAKIWFSINNTWQASGDPAAGTNEAFSSLPAVEWCPAGSLYNATNTYNFGQSAFAYTPPTDFLPLNSSALPDNIVDPSAYFQTTLYTGNGTAIGSGGLEVNQSENSTFQPDFVWIKNRSAADNHMLYDSVRGATKDLHSNAAAAEVTDTEGLSTFDTDGFTVGSNVEVNTNTENYVAWQWLADNTSGSSNTDGSITSTVAVNTTSGFSVISYTGNSTNNATVGHGLGIAPSMLIIFDRSGNGNPWVWHKDLNAVTSYIQLNSANAQIATPSSGYFTAISSSTLTLTEGSSSANPLANFNTSGRTYVQYAFTEVDGFSKFTSFAGNSSSNGPFIYTGFRPAYVLVKVSSGSTGSWRLFDTTRNPYNVTDKLIYPNLANAEATSAELDILSNGFKIRVGSGYDINDSGDTMIVAAFAESPFKTANAR